MKIPYTAIIALSVVSSTAFAQLSVSNPDFVDIDWWSAAGGTAAAAVGQTETAGSNPMETDLGVNWRSNPAGVSGRDGARSFLLGSDYSPVTGRDDFASLSIFDNGQIYTYLGQATQAGTITIQWRTALRSDSALDQNNLSFQFQTSTVGDFSAAFADAGASSSYDQQSIVLTDTEWQTVQHESGPVNVGDHVYFYWFAVDGSTSNQTLIQDISITFTPYAVLDVFSTDDLTAGFTLFDSVAVPDPGSTVSLKAEITAP